ncbi:methyl-accepting chemotaxis protein [Pseudoalteromonas sp. MMG005]|uniref:methyl-accepting chemotaxis protein n=1 Tax=Pseudoalteromonas sp. MMG005 TaxID=2822682 RepID=UPI001B3A0762|nr:methyl-accepting chemotaxis protein [Pseudoalteromonas sp. MMG005]MBQ4847926.1 methyl-accepting chemotaxis protein [Pseudoalteromonas sp. MMG005]
MEFLASLFIETETVITALLGIISFAFFQYRKFSKKVNPIIDEFKNINETLKKSGHSKSEFCAFYDSTFNESMSKTKYLSDSWREFNETLLIPYVDFEPDNEDEKILNTHHTSTYFNQRYILWSKVNMRWFNALPNILTGIGIVGTFIGLVAGIYIASPGLSADNIDEAKKALNVLLSGASLAFLTSIAGLSSSMLFSKAEKNKIHEFDRLCQDFVAEIDERVEYFSAERLSNKVLQESKKQSFALETFANDLAVTMGQVMQEQVAEPLVEAINELTENQKSANDETIEKVMEEFAASISGAAGVEMQSLAETIKTISAKLEEQLIALSDGHKAMNETATFIMTEMTNVAENASTKINDLSGELGNAVTAQKGLNESNGELHERIKDTVFTAGNVIEKSNDVLENANTTVDKQIELISQTNIIAEQFSNTAKNIEQTHVLISDTQDQIKQNWKDYQDRFTTVDESLGNMFNNLNDGMSQYARSTNEYLIELDKHAAKVVKELAFASKEISDSIESLGDGLEQHSSDFMKQISSATSSGKKATVQ